jgi:formiminotetrahydrofolate cyclodeaminase
VQDQTIRTWLDQLASSTPAPGGGAASALNAAVGAALVEMVCDLTIGKRDAGSGQVHYRPVPRPPVTDAIHRSRLRRN